MISFLLELQSLEWLSSFYEEGGGGQKSKQQL